jgi:hypothetical protein
MARTDVADVESVSVVHHIAGRLRVRIPPRARVGGLVEAVSALPGVRSASWSPRTRGLLVLYDRTVTDGSDVVEVVEQYTGADVAAPSAPTTGAARTSMAAVVTSVASEADARVKRASGGLIGLSALLPLALTAWAAREILRGRAAPLAWSSALWYAHGLFRDYNLSGREG